eukprot:gene8113-5649_t
MTYLTNPSAPATPPARHTGAGVQHRHMMIDSNNIVVMTTRDITHCRPSLTPRCPSHPPARCVVVALLGQASPGSRSSASHPGFNAPRLHQQHLIGRGVRPQRMASHDEVVCQIPHARLQQQQPSAVVIVVVVWIYRSSSCPTRKRSKWTLTRLKTTFALSDRAVFHTPASALPPHASRGALSRGRTASSCSGTAPCLGGRRRGRGAIEQGGARCDARCVLVRI